MLVPRLPAPRARARRGRKPGGSQGARLLLAAFAALGLVAAARGAAASAGHAPVARTSSSAARVPIPSMAAGFDAAGRLASGPHRAAGVPTAFCDSCPDPMIDVFGIEFRRGELWTVGFDGTLSRLVGCRTVQVAAVQGFRGFATGLGYDSRRDQFVVVDALFDTVFVVDLRGVVRRQYAAPGSGCVGAAYDSTRDAYWFTDFETDSMYAVDAVSGARVAAFKLPVGTRSAGAVYDPVRDAILYEDRVFDTHLYVASCTTGALLASYPLPFTGVNGWEDNTLAPDGSVWIHDFEEQKSYCFRGFAAAAGSGATSPPADSRSAPRPGR